jgi:hypothetical protein
MPIITLILAAVIAATGPASAAHAAPQLEIHPATAVQTAAPPKTLQPRGYDPYYRVPAATPAPRHAANRSAKAAPTRTIVISLAFTLTICTALVAHVRRARA